MLRRSRAPTRSRASRIEMRATWGQIEALDTKIKAATQYEMMYETTRLLRFCTYWLIHHQSGQLDIERQVSRLRSGLAELDARCRACSPAPICAFFENRRAQYRAANVPEALAKRMASLAALRSGPDLVEIAEQKKLPVEAAARVYFGVGTALSLDWIREQIEQLERRRSLAGGGAHDSARQYLQPAAHAMHAGAEASRVSASRNRRVRSWITRHQQAVDYLRQTVTRHAFARPEMDFATLSVALQAVRRMAEG